MIRLTKISDYGIVLLTAFAQAGSVEPRTARDLAAASRIPLPMVSKILKALAKGRLLESHRGVRGGYCLARRAEEISVAEIINALEGPIAIAECVEGSLVTCNIELLCPVRGNWQKINDAVIAALGGVTLADMAQPMMFRKPADDDCRVAGAV